MKGLLVNILKSGTDCTNGGVTAKAEEAVLCGPGVPEIFEASDDCPALLLQKKECLYGGDDIVYAVPINKDPRKVGWMMGGNFIWASDSRFRRLINAYPIPVHDRLCA